MSARPAAEGVRALRRFEPFSLRIWLPLVLLAFTALVLGYIYRSALEHDRAETEADALRSQAARAVHLQADIEDFVHDGEPSHVQAEFAALSANPEIAAALYADTQGRIVLASQMALAGQDAAGVELYARYAAAENARTWLSPDHKLVLSSYPITGTVGGDKLAQRRVGTLFSAYDLALPLAQRGARTTGWMLKSGALALCLVLLVWLVLYAVVSRRIGRLLRAIDNVGKRRGDMLSAVSGRDEIGRLGMAFDEMVVELEQTSAQLLKLSKAVEQSATSVIVTNRDGTIEYVNTAFTAITGYAPHEVIGRRASILSAGETAPSHYEELWATITAGEIWRGEMRNRRKNGELYWDAVVISPVRDEGGEITHFVSIQEDVSARKASEERLQLFLRAITHVSEGIAIANADREFVFVNPAFSAITGYSAVEVIGRNPRILNSGLMSDAFYRDMWRSINETGRWQGEIIDRNKSGDSYVAWLSISTMRDARGEISHYVSVFSDISERRETEARMAHMAQHDFLTGLPNRMLLQDRLAQAIARAEREQHRVAVFFMDLDRFKIINDTLGHLVGDKLLQEVAGRLSGASRASDTVCRQGGDEFVVVLPELVSVDDVPLIAIKLLQAVAGSYAIDGHDIEVTTSIGISMYPEDGLDGDTLLKHADTAMYHAKESGRNNYQFYTGRMTTRALERSTIEMKLRRALERDEFLLHYQPQLDRISKEIVGAEALLRWNDPERGMVPPGQFIPIAEENGMIVPIGEWVLREACRQNAKWRKQGLPPITIAVNLSAAQFRQKNLGETILGALQDSGLPPSGLELEITESAIIRDAEAAILLLYELRDMGVNLALDDFGTGYSSLGYLKLLPIDKLKIDQSFVRDMTEDESDAALVSTIINMARNLRLKPIAEGVETEAQFNALSLFGCDEVQGYYFSKPLPPDEFADFFRSHLTC